MSKPLKTIREDPREEWLDNEVHRHYNMPMVVVRAEPHILMHCNVYRDTTSLLKTSACIDKWVNTEYFIWAMSAGLADSGVNPQWTEFFENQYKDKWVQIQNEFESIADLPERFLHEVPSPPFEVAELILKQKSPTVGPFDVILRAPLHTPVGEDPIDPWNISL
ncbi:unnamed protein product [Penicillium palitans]